MQKYFYTVYRLLITVIAFTVSSTLCAQTYPVTPQTDYYSGNRERASGTCRTIFEELTQAKTACKGTNDATFNVTFLYDAGSDYYFWWPSLGNKGIAKTDTIKWYKVTAPGTTPFTVPSESSSWTHGGFGKTDESGYLYVYSATSKWVDSIAIVKVDEFPDLNPGTITTSSSTVCAGGAPDNITQATAPSGGSGTFTYEWYKGEDKIDGASAGTYTPAAETTPGEYKYTRKVIQGQCNVGAFSTGTYTLTVTADPTITGITKAGPGSATICYGTDGGTLTATPSLTSAVGAPYTYTWQKWEDGATTWTTVPGNSASTYAPGDLTKTTAFRASAAGAVGCAADFSTPATITVYPAFSAGAFNANSGGTVCVNGTPGAIPNSIQQTAPAGSGSYTYEWYRNGDESTPVATSAYFTPSSESITGAVTYTRKVFDKSCSTEGMTSGSYILTVTSTPTVSLAAASTTVCYNTPATIYTSSPVANAISYAWESSTNGTDWAAAAGTVSANSFTTGNLTTNTYYSATVTVSDIHCPTVVSAAPATVTVRSDFNPGAITPATYTICAGGAPVQINNTTAASGGDGTITYKWTYSYNGGTLTDISSSNSANYTPSSASVTAPGTYHYQRWAKDGSCQSTYTVSTGTYTLTVVADPTITSITVDGPGTSTICNGAPGGTLTANLSPIAVGGPYTYTWQQWEDGATTWTVLSGNASTYAPGDLTKTTAFRVSATGSLGCATNNFSTPATITVHPAFSAGTFKPNSGGTVCVNGAPGAITNAIQQTPPAGSGSYTYAWYRNGNTTPVSTSAYFTPSSESVTGAVTYTRKVFDASCSGDEGMTSGSYILTVTSTPTVSLAAASTTICYNTPTTIYTSSTVTGATSYTWKSSTDGLTWDAAAGTVSANSFTTANLITDTYYSATVAVNNAHCPTVVSAAPATVTVRSDFNPGAITSDIYTICVGGTPTSITGTTPASGGDEAITYTWTYSYNGGTLTDIPSSNSENYTPPSASVTTAGTYHYQRWATDGSCQSTYTVSANTYTLVVLPAPSVAITPATQEICYGATATFTVNITNSTGGAATYTWEQTPVKTVGWIPAGTAYGSTFTSGTLSEETAFRVNLTQPGSGCTSTLSTPATVTLNQETPVYTPPADITVVTDAGACTKALIHGPSAILQGTYTATCPLDSVYYTITGATAVTGPKTAKENWLQTCTFNKGVSVVTYTVKNALGKSASSTFSVTVTDGEPPAIIKCKNGDVYLNAEGKAVIDVRTLIEEASDNCGSATLVYEANPLSSASFTCADVGLKQIRIRAKDDSNNWSTECAATITVHNEQLPVAICKPRDTVYLSVNNGVLDASRLAAASSTAICVQQSVLNYYILNSAADVNPINSSKTFTCTDGGKTHTVYVGVKNTVNNKMEVCSTEVLVTDTVLQCTPKAIDTLYLGNSCSYTLVPAKDGHLIPLSVASPYRCGNQLQPVPGMKLTNNKGFDIYQDPFVSPQFAAGTHEITWTLKDDFGDRATCKDVFAVVDTIRPVFTSSVPPITRTLAPGSCTVSVTGWSEPSVTDNCAWTLHREDNLGNAPLNLTAGTYLVKYVAKDAAGNVSKDTSKILITVEDTNWPDIATIADTTMKVDNDTDCFATVPAGGLRPVISRVCATGLEIAYTTDYAGTVTGPSTTTAAAGLGGVRFNLGATAVTYTATAANGHSHFVTFTVTVQDTVKPKITCKSNVTREYDDKGEYKVAGDEFDVTVANKCDGSTPALQAIIAGSTATYSTLAGHVFSGAESFNIIWTATDAATNTSSCSFTVTMNDTIKPWFTTFPDTIRVNTAATACAATVTAAQLAATYTDNVTPESAITVTHKITYKGAETTGNGLLPETAFAHDTTVVTYTITDLAGNSRDSSFLVIVTDSVPPVLTCPANITGFQINPPTSTCLMSSPATLTPATYTDNCAVKTLSWSITGSRGAQDTSLNHSTPDIAQLISYKFAAGSNTVRYTATDKLGNTAACTFTVEVVDNVDPICESVSTYTLKLQNTSTTTLEARWLDNGSTDNCGTLTYSLSVPADATFGCSDIGKVRNVNLVVSDDFGNNYHCGPTKVSVADTIVPVVQCKNDTVFLDAQGKATLTANDLETSAADNCTAAGQLLHDILRAGGTGATNDTTFTCTDVGQVYTLTVRVRDAYDNAGTCTSTVTVRDTLLKHHGRDSIPADPGACAATLDNAFDPEIVSGCSAATLTNSENGNATYAGMTLTVGTHHVVWTLNDGIGTKTVTDTIIVKDTQKPVLKKTTLTNVSKSTLTCASDPVTWNEPGIYIDMPDTLAVDNCTDPRDLDWWRADTITSWGNGSGLPPVGRWKIQYVAKDVAGNVSDTLSFFVIVRNSNTPSLSCPAAAQGGKDTIFVTENSCTATVPAAFASTVTNLCPGADSLSHAYTFNGGTVTQGEGSLAGKNLPVGLYSVTYTATNKFAVTPAHASCYFTLLVRDTIKPEISCVKDTIIKIGTACDYTVNTAEFDPKVKVHCGSYTLSHNYNGGGATLAGAVLPVGAHTVTWTATNPSGITATCEVKMKVVDNVPPAITCPPPVDVIVLPTSSCTTTASIGALSYNDNCNVIDSLTWSIRSFPAAFDSSSNYGNDAISTVPGTYSFSAGTHVITYTVTDISGNRNACSFTVPVRETVAPNCVSHSTYTLKLQGPGTTTLNAKQINNGSTDNCTAPGDLVFGFDPGSNPDFTCADIDKPRGVRLRVTDVSGMANTCGITTITVIDTIAPTVKLKKDTTLYVNNTGEIQLYAAELDSASADNCTALNVFFYHTGKADTVFKCADVTTFDVTVAVADAYNNVGTHTVSVTVEDTLRPVIRNRGRITVPTTGATGCVAVLLDTLNPVITSGSSCTSLSSVTNSENGTNTYAGLQLSAGTHEITWTAEANGLTTTVADTITVIDTLAPEITTPMNNLSVQSTGGCLSLNNVHWDDPLNGATNIWITDNCTAASALTWTRVDDNVNDVVWGQKVKVGKWDIQYVAKDAFGNVSDTIGFVLTVYDDNIPVLSDCPSGTNTLYIDANECYATVPATFKPTVSGLCDKADSLVYKLTGGTFTAAGEGNLVGQQLPVGQYSATYTIFNRTNLSYSDVCAFDIEVIDNIAPVVTCVDDTSFAIDKDGHDIVILAETLVEKPVIETCTPASALTYSFSNSVAAPGTTYTKTAAGHSYTHTVYVKDASNNTGSCTVTVTIIDTIAPVITLNDTVTVYLDETGNGALIKDSVIIHMHDNVTDSIDIATILTPNTFTCADVNQFIPATFTATDGQHNESAQTLTVHVRDTIKPQLTCKTDTLLAINAAGDQITLTAESLVTTAAARGCAANTALTYSFSNSAAEPAKIYNCGTLGTYTPTIYVTDINSNVASCTVTVEVKDTLPPVITPKKSITVNTSPATLTVDEVIEKVTDNCTNPSTVTIKNVTLGSTTFTCADNIGWIYAEDASGNKDSVIFKVFFTSSAPATVTARDVVLYLDANGAATLSAYEVVETVTDGCVAEPVFTNPDNGLLWLSKTDFACGDGEQIVTIYAQGPAPTPGTATFKVTVADNLKPTITCASGGNKRVNGVTQCEYEVSGTEFDPVATADNCGVFSVLHNYSSGGTTLADTLLPVGAHTITWTVTDTYGNTQTCDVVVTVNDDAAPEITCKTSGQTAYLDENGSVSVNAEMLVTVKHECAPLSALTYTFDADGAGTHTYDCDDTLGVRQEVIRVTDLSGNYSVCTAQFTVRDTVPPEIGLKNNPIHLNINSATGITPPITESDVLDFKRDNCTTNLAVNIVPQEYSCTVTAGTVTVTDNQGLSSSATFSVVLDNIPSMDIDAPDLPLTLDEYGAATLSAYDVVQDVWGACVNKDTILDPAKHLMRLSRETFGCEDVGKTIVDTIFIKQTPSSSPETFTVNVTVHNSPPKLTCLRPGFAHTIYINNAKCDTIIPDNSIDINVNVVVSNTPCYDLTNNYNGVPFGFGTHTLTWTVTDAEGHTDACSKTLTVLDMHKPDIVCMDDAISALDDAGKAIVKAEDLLKPVTDCGSLTYTFSTGATEITYGCDDIGAYPLTVTVTDAANNSSTCSGTVTVSDTTRPVVTVNSPVTVKAYETVTPEQVIATLSDNCTDSVYMANNFIDIAPNTFTCDYVGSGETATLTVRDKAGNEASATFTVNVEAMKPAYDTLLVKDTTLYTCNPADTLPSNTGEITSASVTVCGPPATVTYTNTSNRGADPTKADFYNYEIRREWKAVDVAGNDSIWTQIITVRDTTRPYIETVSSSTVYIGQNGTGQLDTSKVLLRVLDCADSVHVTIQFPEFHCNDIGTPQTITVNATDPSGNVNDAATLTVNVLDTLPPVIGYHDAILSVGASGTATLTPSMVIVSLDDNCTSSTATLSRSDFYTDDIGETIPVWIYAVDEYGNRDSVQVNITVEDDVRHETIIEKRIKDRNGLLAPNATVNQGDTVTFVLTVTNDYGGDRKLSIVDSLPEGLSLIEDEVPNNAFVDLTGKVVTILLEPLAEGATVSYTLVARALQEGTWVNRTCLYRDRVRHPEPVSKAEATVYVLQPALSLTAKIREGDYTNTEVNPAIYNVPGDYHLVVSLENSSSATVNRVDVQTSYDPEVHQFVGASQGGVTDNGREITWTIHDFEGNANLELMFKPRIAAIYHFVSELRIPLKYLPYENPADNAATVTVNQAIIKVPNVLTATSPELYIEDLNNNAVEEASIKVFNTWGNQVYYARFRRSEITPVTCWFDSTNLARGTYWYDLVIQYQNGSSYTIRDYVEVLK